jgi:hypothetical protein
VNETLEALEDARRRLDGVADPVVVLEWFAERLSLDDGLVQLTVRLENGRVRGAELGPRRVGRHELVTLARIVR